MSSLDGSFVEAVECQWQQDRQYYCPLEAFCGTGNLIMEDGSRREACLLNLEKKHKRMSYATQMDLHRVTGCPTFEALFAHFRFLKQPQGLLPGDELPDSELVLLLDIGGVLTCTNSVLTISHILLVQAVFSLRLHKKRDRPTWFNLNQRNKLFPPIEDRNQNW